MKILKAAIQSTALFSLRRFTLKNADRHIVAALEKAKIT